MEENYRWLSIALFRIELITKVHVTFLTELEEVIGDIDFRAKCLAISLVSL